MLHQNYISKVARTHRQTAASQYSGLFIAFVVGCVLLVGVLFFLKFSGPAVPAPTETANTASQPAATSSTSTSHHSGGGDSGFNQSSSTATSASSFAPSAPAQLSSYGRQLAMTLATNDLTKLKLTAEEEKQWKDAIQKLAAEDPSALSGLARGLTPAQLEKLTGNLESLAPGQFSQMALDAANSMLAMGAQGMTNDAGPLFHVLEQAGGSNAIPQLLEASSQWKYYSAIALADLPDGAGVPALLDMVQNPQSPYKGARLQATEMLAEAASQSPEAAAALLDLAKKGQIPGSLWAAMAPVLGGNHFQIGATEPGAPSPDQTWHLGVGNQNFVSTPDATPLTADQVTQRVTLINQLMAVSTDPGVKDMLQKALVSIQARGSAPHP